MSDSQPPKNVINLGDRRRRKKAKPKTPKGQKARGPQGNKISWGHYLQFFLFIGLLAYVAQLCSR